MITNAPRRVVVTGMGVVSPLGNTLQTVWEALRTGRCGIGPIQSMPTEHLPIQCGGESRDFRGHIDDFGPLADDRKKQIRKGLKVMCRDIQMGVAAAQLALTNAQLDVTTIDPDRMGVVFGADHVMTTPEEFTEAIRQCFDAPHHFDLARWPTHGIAKVTPLWLLKYLPNMPASHIAIYNDLRGPSNSLTYREASGNLAVGEAYCAIVRGSADRMVTGATGCYLHPLKTLQIALQSELATRRAEGNLPCRPFDRERTGMVLGEGAGALVLEELEMARARGATILAEVLGQGSSVALQPNSVTNSSQAIANAMRMAMRGTAIRASEVGHIHAHGLGTHQADRDEAHAIHQLFGAEPGAHVPPVTAAKSFFGNLGAGTGAVELVCTILALQHQQLFPILGYQTPDPTCPIRAATGGDTPAGNNALNISFTMQGQASCVLVRRWNEG